MFGFFKISPLVQENFKVSVRSVLANKLRSILTVLIIAFGIMALVGILTAIDSIKGSINSEFTNMGANTFKIQNRGMRIHMGGSNKRHVDYRAITYREAQEFKEAFNFPATTSLSAVVSHTSTVKYNSKKTNPNIAVFGTDENYLMVSGNDIKTGRNFTPQEVILSRNVVIIGKEIEKKIFEKNQSAIDKVISIGNGKYKVIGVLAEKGASMSGAGDKICILPLSNARQYFAASVSSFVINVMPNETKMVNLALSEAEGLFRKVRKVKLYEDSNFEIIQSDSLVNILLDNIKYVTIAATLIGIITLLGAAIGLMNIMLVSVTERTKEIGTRKAMGATSGIIKQQFLFEAIFIGQLGGFLGIILGIVIGNLVSLLTDGSFIVPWMWIIGGSVLCFFVGLVSGLYPAAKAAKLDPIEALRYE